MGVKQESRAREDAKLKTREALIRAGMAEFVEHGLDVPSLDAICARAGYTRGAFYVHFRDRDDFVVAVMESVLGDFLDAIIAGGEAGGGIEETVVRFAQALVQGNALTGESGSMRTHHLIDVCTRSERIRLRFLDMLGEAQRRVAAAAAGGQRAGTVRSDLPATTLGALLVVLAMGVVQVFELGMPLDFAQLRTTVLRLLGGPVTAGGELASERPAAALDEPKARQRRPRRS
jgi:AcrR family transcriptional regulator